MEIVSAFIGFVLAVLFKESAPLIAQKIVEAAARRVRADLRASCFEEWSADVDRRRTDVGRLISALHILFVGAAQFPRASAASKKRPRWRVRTSSLTLKERFAPKRERVMPAHLAGERPASSVSQRIDALERKLGARLVEMQNERLDLEQRKFDDF